MAQYQHHLYHTNSRFSNTQGFWDELPPSTAPWMQAFEREPLDAPEGIPIHREEHPPPEPAHPGTSRPSRGPKVPQKQRKQQSPALAPVVQPEWRQTEVTWDMLVWSSVISTVTCWSTSWLVTNELGYCLILLYKRGVPEWWIPSEWFAGQAWTRQMGCRADSKATVPQRCG